MKGMPTVKKELDQLCRYARTGARVMTINPLIVRPVLDFTSMIGKATMGKEISTLADKTFLTDNSKAKKLLGWKPKYNNLDALKAGYDWFRNNHETAKPKLSLPLKIAIKLL
jgi:nucleoside-diphosphate-sugar epimerase